MAGKPLDQWTPDELRLEIARLAEELARRAGTPTVVGGRRAPADLVKSCENWVRGRAWDETFTVEMVEDELAVHERKLNDELQPLERDRLVQLWRALYAERYPAAA
jgi:hypothetical protein